MPFIQIITTAHIEKDFFKMLGIFSENALKFSAILPDIIDILFHCHKTDCAIYVMHFGRINESCDTQIFIGRSRHNSTRFKYNRILATFTGQL